MMGGGADPFNNFDGNIGLLVIIIIWLLHALLSLKQCHMAQQTFDVPPKFSASAVPDTGVVIPNRISIAVSL